MSELGEVLSSDKRWKNFRNDKLDLENKREEIADCFIVLMNVAIFSGFTAEEVESSILKKIKENYKRIM
jgi:NTP pyrophosphatase (non-canonical NTP hydrolase)